MLVGYYWDLTSDNFHYKVFRGFSNHCDLGICYTLYGFFLVNDNIYGVLGVLLVLVTVN